MPGTWRFQSTVSPCDWIVDYKSQCHGGQAEKESENIVVDNFEYMGEELYVLNAINLFTHLFTYY